MTNERPAMTADELAAELYRRQGHLVMGWDGPPLRVGEIVPGPHDSAMGSILIPMRVVAHSCTTEFDAQHRLVCMILECEDARQEISGETYYRVEAAD